MVKALLFDLDDTLLDHQAAVSEALLEWHRWLLSQDLVDWEDLPEFECQWHQITERAYQRFAMQQITFVQQRRLRVMQIVNRPLSDNEADELYQPYLHTYRANWRLFPDVKPMLLQTTNYQKVVITNGADEVQKRKLQQLGIADYFDHIITSESEGVAKPNPKIYQQVINRLGLEQAHCLMVGDDLERDYHAARAAGLHSLWLNRKGKKDGEGVDQISGLNELLHHL